MTTFEYLIAKSRSWTSSERGAALVEYALLLAFIAVICIAAVGFLGDQLSEGFDSVGQSVDLSN